jgi:hypothetical protein
MISTGTCVACPAAGSVPTIVNGYAVPADVNDPDHVGTLTALAGNCPSGRIGPLARFSWKFDVVARFAQAAVPGPPDAGPPPLMADDAGTTR